jgi:hypothetical protein
MGECEQIVTKTKREAWLRGERNMKYKDGDRPMQSQPHHVSAGELCFCDGAVMKTKLKEITFVTRSQLKAAKMRPLVSPCLSVCTSVRSCGIYGERSATGAGFL